LEGDDNTPEGVAAQFAQMGDATGQEEFADAFAQTRKYARNAAQAQGLDLAWGE